MSWAAAEDAAAKFLPFLEQHVPHLVEEMRGEFPRRNKDNGACTYSRTGIADGAALPFAAVLALNARTEISMGMMDDGCTSLAWKTDQFSVAGQNWDVSYQLNHFRTVSRVILSTLSTTLTQFFAVGGSSKS